MGAQREQHFNAPFSIRNLTPRRGKGTDTVLSGRMHFHAFTRLSEEVQLAYVYRQGAYLARRWDDVHQAVNLYHLPEDFFVEVHFDLDRQAVTHLFSFEAGGPDDRLEDYAPFVTLPDGLGE
jgi:hypothetical protein